MTAVTNFCHLRIQCARKRAREIMQFDVSARQIKGRTPCTARGSLKSAIESVSFGQQRKCRRSGTSNAVVVRFGRSTSATQSGRDRYENSIRNRVDFNYGIAIGVAAIEALHAQA